MSGNWLREVKRVSADGQNIAQYYTSMRVVVKMLFCLECSQTPKIDTENAVTALKKGKFAGVDNITTELVKVGGDTVIMIGVLTDASFVCFMFGAVQFLNVLILTLLCYLIL